MMSLREPRCSQRACKHFRGAAGDEETGELVVCDAFPDGIPDEIAYGDNMHLQPFPGDHGIRFEVKT